MRRLICWIILLGAGIVADLGADTAGAQDASWPAPPGGWWAVLEGGESATFEVVSGNVSMEMVLTVDKVNDSQIVLGMETIRGEDRSPKKTRVVDVAAADMVPPGAKVRKGSETEVVLSGNTLRCTTYELTDDGFEMSAVHCPELPPIFNGGNARVVTGAGEPRSVTTLKTYKGGLLNPP
ncbi:MAG: hypothetical protein U9Q81_05105 [Pseudomonadota bacterium]|nr:hypothetical protein [Pseudomonadota bacterium]